MNFSNIYITLFIFFLLILIVENIRFLSIYIKSGTFTPSNLFLLGLFNYDSSLGYTLKRNFTTKPFWKNSEKKRKNLDGFFSGMGKEITINENRHRGKICSVKKPKDTIRIIMIGASTTFGAHNDDPYTIPQLLEDELNNSYKDRCFEVMNLGVGGYKFHQCVRQYLRDFIEYDVDIILTACCYNDYKYFHSNEKIGRMGLDAYEKNIKKFYSQSQIKHYMSYFWNKSITRQAIFIFLDRFVLSSLKLKKNTTTNRAYGDCSINMNYYKTFYTPERFWIKNYIKWYDVLYKEVKKRHPKVKHAFVGLPVLMSDDKFYKNSEGYTLPESLSITLMSLRGYDSSKPGLVDYHARYLAHTYFFEKFLQNQSKKNHDSDFISLYYSFANIPYKERVKYFVDEVHLTNTGNKILANELSSIIEKKYL